MSKEEIRERISTLETRIFLNEMVNRWDSFNYKLDKELRDKVKALKKELDK